MKKQRVSHKQIIHRQEAKLVAMHGFDCLNDIFMFSSSLDKEFLEWAYKYVIQRGIMVINRSSVDIEECMHKSQMFGYTVRLEVMEKSPKKWWHIYHVNVNGKTNQHPKQIASTMVVDEPFCVHSQVAYVWDEKLCEGATKSPEGHLTCVEHHHTEDTYRFVVKMQMLKNE